MSLEYIRAEIERMRAQIYRQRHDIKLLQRAGISTASADALLVRMQSTVDKLCEERDKLIGEARMNQATYTKTNKVIRSARR